LGNLLVQARGLGVLADDAALRRTAVLSAGVEEFRPAQRASV
jgi:hypothetical protein